MAKRGGHKLKEEHKVFVTQRLAVWDTPKEAAAALNEEFGVQITPQAAERYDPTKRAGRRMAQKWRKIFEETRKAFTKHLEDHIPEANRAVRVRHLAHAARTFKSKGNYIGMQNMLESIAKELGNVHTNRRELTGRDGKPIEAKIDYTDMTDEQLDARLGQLLRGMVAGGGDGDEQRSGA